MAAGAPTPSGSTSGYHPLVQDAHVPLNNPEPESFDKEMERNQEDNVFRGPEGGGLHLDVFIVFLILFVWRQVVAGRDVEGW